MVINQKGGINTVTSENILHSLQSIGYKKNLIKRDYSFTDFLSTNPTTQVSDLAVFGHEPLDYRSSCFSIKQLSSNISSTEAAQNMRALGAPHIFIISNGTTERWENRSNKAIQAELLSTTQLGSYIKKNKRYFSPNEVIRQKSDFNIPADLQLDIFVDSGLLLALEHEATERIDNLIKSILHRVEQGFHNQNKEFNANVIFKVLFRLLTAKLLNDRAIKTDPLIDLNNPIQSLEAVSNYYENHQAQEYKHFPKYLLEEVSAEINNSISFKNLSVDTLTYIYENTFVSPTTRKKLGIHSTPSYIADYVLANMPIENLPLNKLRIYDPTCGHGIFLIAALRRLRSLLPNDWTGKKRHDFFIKHLIGTEIDPFSIEVAKMCLTLADFPEANGWEIIKSDIFNSAHLENIAQSTNIFIGNPPFENYKLDGVDIPKPVLMLQNVLPNLPFGGLFGLVLPKSVLDSNDYKKIRENLLTDFSILSITNLPDKVFSYSDSETSIVIAEKQKKSTTSLAHYKEIRDSDREKFKSNYSITWDDKITQEFFHNNENLLIVPYLRKVWEYLDSHPTLQSISHINIGVQHQANDVVPKRDYMDDSFPNSAPAIAVIDNGFQQFHARTTKYIPTKMEFRRRNAWDYDWGKPKVVVPCGRLSRGPWRFAAALDLEGRYVTRNFYAIWSKNSTVNEFVIAGILNSPLAAAFAFCHSTQRGIPKRVYEKIPIPKNIHSHASIIEKLVQDYLSLIKQNNSAAKEVLMQLDAEVLAAYNISPKMERQLLDLFWGVRRPVSFEFTGYIPPQNMSWIPLKLYLSEEYKNSTLDNYLKSLPRISDRESLDFLQSLGTEDE
ncbi:MAG: N-6 DNA methylase [Bacteroidetes bacterium]|nr:N-6 DNA methylase [Bacteroidota bacterium]